MRRSETTGEADLQVDLVRTLQTANGMVDCAESPRRCLVGVRVTTGDLLAPISFVPDLGPLPVAVVDVDRSFVPDGGFVNLAGLGFPPNTEVLAAQCIGRPDDRELDGFDAAYRRCDQSRFQTFTTDADGRFRAPVRAYAEIVTGDGRQRCDPCILQARAPRQAPAATSLTVDAPVDEPAVRPTVTIAPGPPYELGQRVTLEGAGFEADQRGIQIGWCGFRTEDPETEIEGDPSQGYTPCVYPAEGFSVQADGRDGSGSTTSPSPPVPSTPGTVPTDWHRGPAAAWPGTTTTPPRPSS